MNKHHRVSFFFLVRSTYVVLITSSCFGTDLKAQQIEISPLVNAHAHNDYEHDRPLLDALDNGFCSVEADIYLVGEELYVAHDPIDLIKKRKLKDLYLDPLQKRVKENGGRVFKDGPTFTLMIDIKRDGKKVFNVLHETLSEYRDMLCRNENGKFKQAAVHVIISGDRPKTLITQNKDRLMGIDGRVTDLDSDLSAEIMPLISDRWSTVFKWRGEGAMPADEKAKLRTIVMLAHAKGRKVRFWATPESKVIWQELVAAKVDLINTDELQMLREFLVEHNSKEMKK